MTGEHEEVEAEDGAPDVGVERGKRPPGAAVEAEDALEPGEEPLDAGAEAAESSVDPVATDHVADLEASVCGEGHVGDPPALQAGEIGLGREATVEGRLARRSTVEVDLSVDHRLGQGDVGGVALEQDAIEDQRRGAAGQTDLVTVEGFAAVLPDDVGVLLEERDHLLAGRDALAAEHAAAGLVDHLLGQQDEVVELGRQRGAAWIAVAMLFERLLDLASPAGDLVGDAQQVLVGATALPPALRIEHSEPAPRGPSQTAGEAGASGTQQVAGAPHQTRQHPHAVPQKLGVRRRVDGGLDDRRIESYRSGPCGRTRSLAPGRSRAACG